MVIDHLRMIRVNVELGFEFYGIDGGKSCKGIKFFNSQRETKSSSLLFKAQMIKIKEREFYILGFPTSSQKTLLFKNRVKRFVLYYSHFSKSNIFDLESY